MIPYEFGYWGIGLIFKRSTVFFRSGCLGTFAAVATYGLCWYLRVIVQIKYTFPGLTSLWGGWTVILTFLLVFRTNIAYGRYMEGIGLLQQLHGVWFNATSNLLAFSSVDPSKTAEEVEKVNRFQHLLVRLMSLMYCTALQEVAVMEDESFDLINVHDLGRESMIHFSQSAHKLEIVMQWVQQLICDHHKIGVLWIAPPILSRVFQELSNGVVLVHDAMKITEYPFPHPYAQMLTVMLLAYTMFLPPVFAVSLASPAAASMLSFVIIFSQWSMNYIAAEIEEPFGDDPNDLEIREMAEIFNSKLITLMDPLSMHVPDFKYVPYKHDNFVQSSFRDTFTFRLFDRDGQDTPHHSDGDEEEAGNTASHRETQTNHHDHQQEERPPRFADLVHHHGHNTRQDIKKAKRAKPRTNSKSSLYYPHVNSGDSRHSIFTYEGNTTDDPTMSTSTSKASLRAPWVNSVLSKGSGTFHDLSGNDEASDGRSANGNKNSVRLPRIDSEKAVHLSRDGLNNDETTTAAHALEMIPAAAPADDTQTVASAAAALHMKFAEEAEMPALPCSRIQLTPVNSPQSAGHHENGEQQSIYVTR